MQTCACCQAHADCFIAATSNVFVQSTSHVNSARWLLLTSFRFKHRFKAACDMHQGSYASMRYLFGFLDSSVGIGFPVLFVSDCFSGPIKLLLHFITAKFIHVQHNRECHLHYMTLNQQYRVQTAVAACSMTCRQSRRKTAIHCSSCEMLHFFTIELMSQGQLLLECDRAFLNNTSRYLSQDLCFLSSLDLVEEADHLHCHVG